MTVQVYPGMTWWRGCSGFVMQLMQTNVNREISQYASKLWVFSEESRAVGVLVKLSRRIMLTTEDSLTWINDGDGRVCWWLCGASHVNNSRPAWLTAGTQIRFCTAVYPATPEEFTILPRNKLCLNPGDKSASTVRGRTRAENCLFFYFVTTRPYIPSWTRSRCYPMIVIPQCNGSASLSTVSLGYNFYSCC